MLRRCCGSQANNTLGVLQQEESALSQQCDQSTKRLEWLSSLPSSGELQAGAGSVLQALRDMTLTFLTVPCRLQHLQWKRT